MPITESTASLRYERAPNRRPADLRVRLARRPTKAAKPQRLTLESPFLYTVPFRCGDVAFASVLHEPKTTYRVLRSSSGGSPTTSRSRRRSPSAVAAPVGLHLRPGQKGTKHLVAQYGDRLVCVRYRYDAERKKRVKTVELVVAESEWRPPFAPDEIVAVRVAFADIATRNRVKQAGGIWNPDRTAWELRYERVVALGLRRRIVPAQHPVLDTATPNQKHPDADTAPVSR